MKLEWERSENWITLFFEENEQAEELFNAFNKKGFDRHIITLDENTVGVLIGYTREKEEAFIDKYITDFSK
tara:strand:+ start:271 stop:483 length:213 start_codon:yes stop_codon:yes gene_type:complete